jgi:hypothetical protein
MDTRAHNEMKSRALLARLGFQAVENHGAYTRFKRELR